MNDVINPGYIRVSDVSAAFANHHKIPKNILDYAADRGTKVHAVIHNLMNDIPVSDDMYDFCGTSLLGYIESWKSFWKNHENDTILHQEERFYNDNLMITGKPDLIIRNVSEIFIFDWKCTNAMGKHWDLQAAGYAWLSPMPVNGVRFVRLKKDGEYPEVKDYEKNYDLFMRAIDLYRRYFKEPTCNLEME